MQLSTYGYEDEYGHYGNEFMMFSTIEMAVTISLVMIYDLMSILVMMTMMIKRRLFEQMEVAKVLIIIILLRLILRIVIK